MARPLKAVTATPPQGGGTVPAKNNLATAISNISAAVEQVAKNGENTHFNYKFARAPDVIRALKELMHQHGVIITQSETDCQMLTPEVIRCAYDFIIEHVPSGETRIIKSSGMMKVTGDKRGFNDRAIQSVATTCKKYLLIGLFNLIVDDMPDVDAQGETKPKLTAHQQAAIFNRLMREYDGIKNVGDLMEWGDSHALEVATLTQPQQQAMRTRFTEKLHQLRPPATVTTLAPSPKSSLQQAAEGGQQKPTISQRALANRAQRVRQARDAGRAQAEVEGPFDELPDHCR